MNEPHNIEAEQAVLGAILLNNDCYWRVADKLTREHFFDQVHAEIFEVAQARITKDHLVSPVTLKSTFDAHEGMRALGGAGYLVRLAGAAAASSQVEGYADVIVSEWERRRLLAAIEDARGALASGEEAAAAALPVLTVSGLLRGRDGKRQAVSVGDAVGEEAQRFLKVYHDGETGARTGLAAIDDTLGPFQTGDLVILGGSTSMGKTSLAVAISQHIATSGQGVVVASLEMTAASLAQRLVSALTKIPYAAIRRGRASEEGAREMLEAAKQVSEWPMSIIPSHVRDITAIYAAARQQIGRFKEQGVEPGLIVVDYLQLVRAQGKGRYEQVTNVSMGLKAMAMQCGVPVLALAQLSRGTGQRESRRPQLSDLRESGQIEQDADTVLFTYREHYWLKRDGPPVNKAGEVTAEAQCDWEAALSATKNVMEVIVAKNRHGDIETVKVGCDMATNRFWNLGE